MRIGWGASVGRGEGLAAEIAEGQGQGGDGGAEVGEEVAVGGVEGDVALVAEGDVEAGAAMARSGHGDVAAWVDGGGDAGVGGAQDPAMVFDGAHAHHIQVLPGCAGVSIPAVVGNIDENVRAQIFELTNLISEDGFVADEGAVGMAAGFEYLPL